MGLDARHLDERPAGYEGEAILAELGETVELQAYTLASLHKQIDRLEAEREQLRDELHMAHAWIRELAAELELAVAQEAEPLTRRARIRALRSASHRVTLRTRLFSGRGSPCSTPKEKAVRLLG